jgi:HD-GYP domain-containing protein (c-di-GMP phosphodiesterase class II)
MAEYRYPSPTKGGASIRIVLALIGIAVNVLLSFVMGKVGMPLFFNNFGTITVAAVGGLFPGIVTAVLTSAICGIYYSEAVYFGFLNAIIAIYTVWYIRKFSFKKISKVLLYVVIGAFFAGTVSTLMNWNLLDGATVARNSEATGLFAASIGGNLFIAYYIFVLIRYLLDLGISAAVAVILLSVVIPQNIQNKFERGNWKQKPLSKEEIADLKEWGKSTQKSMGNRTTSIVISTSLLLVLVTGWTGFSLYFSNTKQEKTIDALNVLKLSAEVIDPDRINDYIAAGEGAEGYLETQELLRKIKDSSQSVENLFFLKFENDAGRRIFDLDGDSVETIPIKIEYEEEFMEHLPQFLAGENVAPLEHGNINRWTRSIFYPIKDSAGRVVCYGVADVSITNMQEYMKSFSIKTFFILLGFFILVIAHNLWVTNVTMVYPIRSMAQCVDNFSNLGYEQEQLDKNVRSIRSLEIETKDEVEQLYNSICTMTLNLSEQMRDLRRLSDTTAKMQDGLIITMADMVENRDSDTGAHIQKTAAYVKIIVEGLQKKGYYAEKIDAKFISDVVRSAPLHDIGKINIPDAVLNKPGKLTDEEFEIIKTHTTTGKKIMEDAISTVRGENYLKEARNMAAYHHERWDGKGYPDGLHGEVIPLSARIMAVADVFDALTSPRVYKPAFPVDKALSIITEGSGTQFDPKCVEVFMENLPEVKVILKKYNREM